MSSESINASTGSWNVLVPKQRVRIAVFPSFSLLLSAPSPQQPLQVVVLPAHLESVQRFVEHCSWSTPVGTRLGRVRT